MSLGDWRLEDPWFLWGLVVLPLLLVPRLRHLDKGIGFSTLSLLDGTPLSAKLLMHRLFRHGRILAYVLMILALSRPQYGAALPSTVEGRDIVLALDRSSSMLHWDAGFEETKFGAARDVLRAFVEERPQDRLSLLSFAKTYDLDCPLTLDHQTLLEALERLEPCAAGSDADGTGLGIALAASTLGLRRSEGPTKIVVLLTDGRNNRHEISPREGMALCLEHDIRVYGVSVGGEEVFDHTFRGWLEETGGEGFAAADKEALSRIYERIDELSTSRAPSSSQRIWQDRFGLFLLPVFLLLAAECLARVRWLRVQP